MAPGFTLADFKKGNFFFTILIVGVFVVLLFIPEIIGLNTGVLDPQKEFSLELPKVGSERSEGGADIVINANESLPVQGQAVPAVERVPVMPPPESYRPLDKVKYLVEGGFYDGNAIGVSQDTRFSLNPASLNNQQQFGSRGLNGSQFPKLSEADLYSKDVKNLVKRVRQQSLLFAGTLSPEIRPASKYALFNFAGGLESMILDPGQGFEHFQVEQVLRYIQHLDYEVTRSLRAENASRAELIAWREISLEPLLGLSGSERFKRDIPKFNPKLTIRNFTAIIEADHQGRMNTAAPLILEVDFVVTGKDIRDIVIYSDGEYVRRLGKKIVNKDKELFFVRNRQLIGRERITIEVINDKGERYKKDYHFKKSYFIPRVRYQYNRGYYKWGITSPLKKGNPIIDRLFTLQKRGTKNRFFASRKNQQFSIF